MAHDPSLGYADYFAAPPGGGGVTLVPEVDGGGEHEMYGDGGSHHHSAAAEMFGTRGFGGMAPKPTLDDVDGSSTISFFRAEQQQQQQYQQMGRAPLSLSLHGLPDTVSPSSSFMLHQQQLGGEQLHSQTAWQAHGGGGGWHLRGSRFLLPTQQLLQEVCSIPVDATAKQAAKKSAQEEPGGGGGSSSSASWPPPSSTRIQSMDAAELQRLKARLYTMIEEVDRRYRRYRDQMRAVAGSFEAVAGQQAAAVYTRMASRTISKHFRSVRDGVAAQVRAVRGALGEKDAGAAIPGMTKGETPRLRALDQCLRQHKAYHSGMLDSHPWRPQRGLPERAVSVLRAWLFEHFLHPYPSDVDKHILARQTGLSRSQVSNWFINARVRLWKPMVEEMYAEEMKDKEEGSGDGGQSSAQQASDLGNPNHLEGSGSEQKPTRAQLHLHDAGSLASVVSVGRGADQHQQGLNFGIMDHLGFDPYEAAAAGFGNGVSLTLGLQHQQQQYHGHGGVNVAAFAASSPSSSTAHGGAAEYLFMAGDQQLGGGVHSSNGGQYGAGMPSDADAAASQQYHRGLSATGFHLLRDLAG
ncbi:BEL1-like homeodomain protein 4 [Lolium rigidum]|uniref:BEL1-like homeodomain protein 4 n=1 Tax=Lolium rigidum TaxID=89674 RepID=UPI001F5D9BBF|nr:BEL1-like homeodomain protein 4 [Lolium rigidum]